MPVQDQLVAPKSGKKVTEKELEEIIEEKVEEFKEERKGGGMYHRGRKH